MYMQRLHSNKSVAEEVRRAALGMTAVIGSMNSCNNRVSSILGTILPLIFLGVLLHYVLIDLIPGGPPNALTDLRDVDRGIAYMCIMLLAGGLLAFSFTNFDRLAGLNTMCPVKVRKRKEG